eukprot:TRINITY_DN10296_c2_g2_i1.p1 TRINITY_DN10296_c2_g2~~TRINITY_DN10296_c2_g2_i1.p1  ORF type:complete len:444 (+),score=113.53 TRINITY_DN10296_c2_g2_i1:71-1333(+)
MAAPAAGLVAGDCRLCLGEGWYPTAPRAAAAGGAAPQRGASQQRPPSVRPARAVPGPAATPPSREVAADPTAELLVPCRCRGTSLYAHKSCLQTWLQYASDHAQSMACSACKEEFRFVARSRGLFTSSAPLAVGFRRFLALYLLSNAVCVFGGRLIALEDSAHSAGAAVLLAAAAAQVAVRLTRGVQTVLTGIALHNTDDVNVLGSHVVGLVIPYILTTGLLIQIAGVLAIAALEQLLRLFSGEADWSFSPSFFLLISGHSISSTAEHIGALPKLRLLGPNLPDVVLAAVAWCVNLAAFLRTAVLVVTTCAPFVHFLVTRRAWVLQALSQELMVIDLATRFGWMGLSRALGKQEYTMALLSPKAVVCVLVNAAFLWVDLRAHAGEHGSIVADVQEPPAEQQPPQQPQQPQPQPQPQPAAA